MTSIHCRTILLPDNPSEKDEFGSHQRVADAIFDLILCDEKGGKTIGLEGGWGSGKSTVVKLLNSKFSQDPYAQDNLVILFDAWAHRDDPLRRTFLESIIIQAEKKGWVDEDRWKKVRDVIAQRLKIESKTTHSVLKPWARWLIIVSLLLPIGSSLLNYGLDNPSGFWGILSLSLGFLFTLLPLIILVCAVVFNHKGKKENSSDYEKDVDRTEPLAFLFQKSSTDTKSETFQTVNPTSIEFENRFADLVVEALSNSKRRMIFVLDNLDRIDPAEALSLLSTLQTFLQYNDSCPEWLNRVWAIIPYDRKGLERLWDEKKNSDWKEQSATKSKSTIESTESSLALSFLDKRFQIRFEVPPILLSGWSDYLINVLLANAFPDHDPSEFYTTYRVFANFRPCPDRLPTPRELILYVNQIGSLHRQWQDKFPLPHYGYYVLRRRAGDDIIAEIRKNTYKDPKVQTLLGEKLADNLAAFLFNVEVEKAYQLVLQEPVEAALSSGDAAKIKEWATFPGFAQTLDSIPFSERVEKEVVWVCNAAIALSESAVLDSIDDRLRKSILGELGRAVAKANSWAPFNLQMARGISAIFSLLGTEPALVGKTITGITSSPIKESNDNQYLALHDWLDGAIYLLGFLKQSLPENEWEKLIITIPSSSVGYIDGCAYLSEKENTKPYLRNFKPAIDKEELAHEFGQVVNKDLLQGHHIGAVDVINLQIPDFLWNELLSEIKAKFSSSSSIPSGMVITYLTILWNLKNRVSLVDGILKELSQQGFLLHQLNNCKNDPVAAAFCLMSFLHVFPDFRAVTQYGSSESGRAYANQIFNSPDDHKEITSQFLEFIGKYSEYDLPLLLVSLPSAKEWVFRILRSVVSRQDVLAFFKNEKVVEHWKIILEALESKEFDTLMERLITNTGILPHIQSSPFVSPNAGLYASAIRSCGAKSKDFTDWCIFGIKQLSQEELQTHIDQEDGIAELIIDLAESSVAFDLGPTFQDILVAHGEKLMDGKVKVEYCANCWDSILLPLADHSRDTLRTRLFDSLKERDGKIQPHFFDIYGNDLNRVKSLEKVSGVVLGFFTPLVKERHARGLKWLVDYLGKHTAFITRYSPNTELADLRDRVQEAVTNGPQDDASETLLQMSQLLEKVKVRKKIAESNNSVDKESTTL